MKFGVCAGPGEASAILAAGFDYIEVGAVGFNGVAETWDPTPYEGLPIPAANSFFQSSIRFFGPERTPYRDYVQRTLERAGSLGVSLIVIGGGNARRAPEGAPCEEAFIDIVAEIAEIARAFGITAAPESLCRLETNVGNNMRDLALKLKQIGVPYTADTYHILYEWDAEGRPQTIEELWEQAIPFAPVHVHIADLPRMAPQAGDPMLQAFASRLRDVHYDGLVSLECHRGPDFNLSDAVQNLRQLFGTA